MTDYSKAERLALCDLFDQVGPDQPTLCEGWTTFDLAAHLYVRENDPIAQPGIMIAGLADTTARRMEQAKSKYGFAGVVGKVRNGPPRLSIYGIPGLGHNLNTTEYLVHHEDVRRAVPDFAVRALPAEQQEGLWRQVKLAAKSMTRKAPTGLVLRLPDGSESVAKKPTADGSVTITGEPVELVLFCFGRQPVAQVELDGEPGAVERLQAASFGM